MFTESDEKNGLVKIYWKNIRNRINKIDPFFTKIVDDLDPDQSFPLYLAYYPYGSYMADTESLLLPKLQGGNNRLTDPTISPEIIKHLGYGKSSAPLGMVIEKEFEYFIDLKHEAISIPWAIHSPGSFFSFTRNLNIQSRIYAPNGILSVTAGTRSSFMLPNIGCLTNHINLQRDFNLQIAAPKSLYHHWYLFKAIINSQNINSDWRACVLYFSEKWINKLHSDKKWLSLRMYLHEKAWKHFEFARSRIYYDITFSIIQKKRNLKPNPYLSDTARHLFTTALGDAPAFIPTENEDALPYTILQKVFVESYGLKKYLPTIMKPTKFNFEKHSYPVYYSLQNPSTFMFSPKSRKVSSTIFEMRELWHIMQIYTDELSKNNSICAGTVINQVANQVEFNYFHNKIDRHQIIQPSKDIILFDKRFNSKRHFYKSKDATFSADSPFVRGCISIKTKK